MLIFTIRYWYDKTEEYGFRKTEYFNDEIDFKSRLTRLQDDYCVSDIEIFSGYIPKIIL